MDQLPGPVDTSVLHAQNGHRSQLVYAGQKIEVLKCWEHYRSLGGWPIDPRIVEYVHRVGLFHLTQVQWIRYSWGGATLAYLYRQLSIACKSDAKVICGSLTLLQVQRIDSSTSDVGPSEPCAGASQILTDEGIPDTQPPQSTVGTYHRQRRHRGSTSTLPQQSQSDLLGETLGSISEDMDSETAQLESCDAILVHETQLQSETEMPSSDSAPHRDGKTSTSPVPPQSLSAGNKGLTNIHLDIGPEAEPIYSSSPPSPLRSSSPPSSPEWST
ncbi:hypothetical protein Taro_007596 [Colocasia esculenta]|uniref:Uncharacterized protein n=1 Tax=Colocasia esculenta TaxID=4460 RepID=A0A843TZD1_COLES|nr:hypothetical protein [Colocasia esculenta]